MRRALLLSFLVMGACTPTQLESGRYACERGQPDQCPGAWRCGLEGFCHRTGDAAAWRCEDSTDCEAGWGCGLTSDGEHRECHDPASPRAWNCLVDEDCVGNWRCGTERACVDPSADALGTLVLAGVASGEHLGPFGSRSPLSKLSVSPFFAEGSSRGRGNAAFVQNGRVRVLSLDASRGVVANLDLGSLQPRALLARGARGANEFGVSDELERVSMLWPDGGLTTYRFADGGVAGAESFGPDLPAANTLSHGSTSSLLQPSVFAFGSRPGYAYSRLKGDDYSVFSLDTEEGAHFYNVPNNHLHAMTSLKFSDLLECVYVVDDRGLWVSQRGGAMPPNPPLASWFFEPVSLSPFRHTECPDTQGPQITSVTALDDRWLAVTSTQGAQSQVSILDASRTWLSRGGAGSETLCATARGLPCIDDDRIPVDLVMGPCEACPSGTTFSSVSLVRGPRGTIPALEVVCGQPGARVSVFQLAAGAASGTCARRPVTGQSSFFNTPSPTQGLPAPGGVAFAGPTGQLWFGESAARLAALSFDRAATGVVRTGTTNDAFFVFTQDLTAAPSPALGLASRRDPQLSAAVSFAPTLAVTGAQLIDLGNARKTIGYTSAVSLEGPVSAVLTRSTQGTQLAVIAAGTAVFAGDVGAPLSSPSPPAALTQRLTTVEPISAIAFPREHLAGSGALLSGYALISGNLVRVIAETLSRWRTEAVPLPSTLTPIATWFSGTRGRVGFHDGSVFSLPSRVRIAAPLPGLLAPGEAVDFTQACGQQLALSPEGLFRLENDGTSAVGVWKQLTLPPQMSGLDFTEGRVHGVGNEVFVFTQLGEAARITFDSCPE